MRKRSFPRWLAVASLLAIVAVATGGAWLYRTQEEYLSQQAETELQGIAHLKADQIAAWRQERLADAAVLMESPFLAEQVARFMASPHAENAKDMLTRFRSLQERYHYFDVLLADSGGQVRLRVGGDHIHLCPALAQSLAEALRERRPVLTDIDAGAGELPPHVSVIAPIFAKSGAAGEQIGAIILLADAQEFLYPLIQSWPTPSRTAETLLVRRDGDSALFLNNLRHRKGAALRLRIPLSRKDVPEVMAVRGRVGVVEGNDYRGVKVFSALEPIPDSPWFMVAKVDAEEVLTGWRTRSVLILALTLALVLAAVAAAGLVWQRNDKAHYQCLVRAQAELRESEDKFRSLFDGQRDAVAVADAETKRVVQVNQAMCEMTGYTREEFERMAVSDVHPEEALPYVLEQFEKQRKGETYLAVDIPVKRKDGSVLLTEVNSAPLSFGGRHYLTGVFRDITERKREEEALRESEERYRVIFEGSAHGILMADNETRQLLYANQAMCRMLGYTKDELLKLGMADIHPKDSLGQVVTEFESQLRGEKALASELPFLRKDGTVFYADVGGAQTIFEGGRQCSVGFFTDITKRKQVEEALQEKERRYRSLWESANEGFCLHDLVTDAGGQAVDYRILEVNPAYERITGLKADDVVRRLASQVYGTGDPLYLEIYARVASTGVSENFEAYFAPMDRHFSISVFSPSPGQFATAFSDISERKAHEEALSYQASHDSLTGLPNRECFERHLRERTASAAGQKRKAFDVMFMDLDKFKQINDTLGHNLGDLLLVAVADRLRSCLRSNDVLARMGGDEFTVIVQSAGRRSFTESVAARITDSIRRPFEVGGRKFVIGVSFGLAAYPSDGTDSVTLLKHADTAMYKAKEAGRGTFRWFTGEAEAENRQRADMERDLRRALENNHLKAHYQPVVRLDDESLYGAEALLRWEHDEKGMISPSLFIPIAEEIGLIGSIGDYVLRTACSQTMAWRDEGMQLSQINVNVSTAQIRDPRWLDLVRAAVSSSGIDPSHLVLELTETDLAADHQFLRASLHKVQELGIGIAIDDFGMGQSSLSRLKDFAVIHLKIDGSFVRDIEYNENDKALLNSIIQMAHDQGIKVTAEWVETEAQADILRSSGCDFAQGFFFSPPLPVDEFRAFALEQVPSAKRKRRAA